MTITNEECVEFVEKELVSIVMRMVGTIEENRAMIIAKEISAKIDWNNSALMHKGLSWMVKTYLIQKKII